MRIAVTGSSGTIGRRLCADLASDHTVVDIDITGSGTIADVRDLDALTRSFDGCDAVVHLAGAVSVGASWEDVHSTNIGGTYNAFEAARRNGVGKFVFASSNHCVGMHEVRNAPKLYEPGYGLVLRGEGEPYRPDSLYGVWKAFGETLGRFYSDAHGMQVTCVRIGSITSADDPLDESVREGSEWLDLSDDEKFKRYAATWMSQADFARLVRAILAHDVAYAIVYGVGDNATRFWDLESGRALFGFWPEHGSGLRARPG